jgi:hypothetical protein
MKRSTLMVKAVTAHMIRELESTMLAKKFRSLVNGGAAAAGADGLRAEINALEAERAKHTAELSDIPARREEVILADDHNDALDKLEALERELYRCIERIDLQVAALRERLPQQQDVGRRALVEHHRNVLAAATATFEAAMIAAVDANDARLAALQEAARELGQEEANVFVPVVHFVGLINNECLEMWRGRQKDQNEKASRRPIPYVPVIHRSPFVWSNAAGAR